MAQQNSSSPRGTLVKLLDRYTLDPFRGAKIELKDLPGGYALMVWLGYALFVALAILSLALDLGGPATLGAITFGDGNGGAFETTGLVLIAAAAGFVAAWAYLLTGGALSRWFVFAPVVAIFLIATVVAAAFSAEAVMWLALVVALFCIGAAIVGRKRNWFPARAMVLLGALTVVLLVCGVLLFSAGAAEMRAQVLYVLFYFLTVPILAIWLFSGLSLMNFSMSFGQSVVRRLRDGMTEPGIKRFGITVAVAHLLIDLVLWIALQATTIGALFAGVVQFDLVLNLLLIPLLILMAARKQWSAQNAGLLIAVRITAFVFTLTYAISQVIGLNLSDPVYAVIEKLGVIPPSFFATATMLLSVVGFFVPFANADGARLPRTARVPLVIGLALLAVAVMFFNANTVNKATGQSLAAEPIYGAMFWAGTLFLGIPFLVLNAFRNRDAFIGPEDGWTQAYADPARAPKRNTAAYLFVLLIPLVLVICGCSLAAATFAGG